MKPIFLTTLATAMLLLTPFTNASAQTNPQAYPQDKRILKVNYQDNNVTPLRGKTFTATQVMFSDDEVVLDVEGGDSTGWMVTHKLDNMVFIKPTVLGSDSNITIVTNKHNYYFHVTSNKTLEETPEQQTYAIKFTYPEDVQREAKIRAADAMRAQKEVINPLKNPSMYNWNYRFSGSTQLAPAHVFDDGTFTYFELAKNQAVPAIFAVDDAQGKEAVVNIRRSGNYLIVQRIAPQFTLRSGGINTSVFNTNEITRIKQGRRPA
ncbi:TPA: P-type conjugative transfer protein VirB9 [Legionella pneumophila]